MQRLTERLRLLVLVGSNEAIVDRWASLMFEQMRLGSRIETADG